MFILASLALTALSVLTFVRHSLTPPVLTAVAAIFMGAAGFASLGFTGIGLTVAAHIGEPVPESLTGGAIEWLIQVSSAILTQLTGLNASMGFVGCCITSWVITIPLLIFYKSPEAIAHANAGK